MSDVILADESDAEVLGLVIADAFFYLPRSRRLVSHLDARRAIFPAFFQVVVEHALANGIVQTRPDRDAVALWLYVEHEVPLPGPDYLLRFSDATGRWISRFVVFDAALERRHPIGEPRHCLNILAVRPDRQGQGIGTSLLSAYHRQIEQTVIVPCYLEAADVRTSQFYRWPRYCALRAEGPFCLADGARPCGR